MPTLREIQAQTRARLKQTLEETLASATTKAAESIKAQKPAPTPEDPPVEDGSSENDDPSE